MKTENQEVTQQPSHRQRVADRMRSRYPERGWEGQDGQEGQDEQLFEAVMQALNELESEIQKRDAEAQSLSDLMTSDPRAAQMLNAWAAAGNPLTFLLETFGPDFKEALESEEGRQKFIEIHNKWLEHKASEEAATSTREENFRTSLETLDAFGQAHNLTDEQKVELWEKVNQIACDAIEGIYSEASLQAIYNASNYDNDVAVAHEEGAIEGRNEKIRQTMREQRGRTDLPPTLGGQGAGAEEREKAPKQRSHAARMFGLNTEK